MQGSRFVLIRRLRWAVIGLFAVASWAATDGVWDHLDNDAAVRTVGRCASRRRASRALLAHFRLLIG